jgi:hypothetical protein
LIATILGLETAVGVTNLFKRINVKVDIPLFGLVGKTLLDDLLHEFVDLWDKLGDASDFVWVENVAGVHVFEKEFLVVLR